MIDAAYSQIGKSLHLPTHVYMGLSDAKINDSQAGLETGMGAVLAVLSGINVVSGPGMLDFESCQSLEKLVVDNEICGMAYRLTEGISQRDDPIAKHLFQDFVAGTQFLTMPHTRRWYRKEHIFPQTIDRDTYDSWVLSGKKTMADRASEEIERLLSAPPEDLLPEDLRQELRRIMAADAKKYGISSLPEIRL
jgi:trimethylamine--corrinoid protein Co-methyltransferase